MNRDNWTCIRCKSNTRFLNVHHKKYIKGHEPWEYDNSDLETLCETCHAIEHKEVAPENPEYVKQLIVPGQRNTDGERSIDIQIYELKETLRLGVFTGTTEEEVLANIVFLQKKKEELIYG